MEINSLNKQLCNWNLITNPNKSPTKSGETTIKILNNSCFLLPPCYADFPLSTFGSKNKNNLVFQEKKYLVDYKLLDLSHCGSLLNKHWLVMEVLWICYISVHGVQALVFGKSDYTNDFDFFFNKYHVNNNCLHIKFFFYIYFSPYLLIWYLLKQFICSYSIYYIFSSYVELTKNIFTLYLICSILSHKSNFAKLKFSLWFFCAKMLPCRHIFFANYRYKSSALINTIFPLKSCWQNLKGKRRITYFFFFIYPWLCL